MIKTYITDFALGMLAVGVIVVACSSATPSPTPIPTLAESPLPFQSPLVQSTVQAQPSEAAISPVEIPTEAPTPETGKASLRGVLYTFSGHAPVPETIFYLTSAVGETKQDPPSVFVGPREEQGDIQGMSDTEGRIFLNNIPPGNYYLAVWAPYNWILVVESATDPTPRLIVVEPNQQEDLGTGYLSWP
mgnify:CR=1 FL=1